MHPRFSPFIIRELPPDNVKCTIVNCKKERAFTFKKHDYLLDCRDMDFALDDPTTYSLLCLLSPKFLWDEICEARKQNISAMASSCGPFTLKLQSDTDHSILVCNSTGDTWKSALRSDTSSESAWKTQQSRRTTTKSHASQPTARSAPRTINRYSILDLDSMPPGQPTPHILRQHQQEGTTIPTDMEIDPSSPSDVNITAHTPEWIENESDGEAAQSGDEKCPPKINIQDLSLQKATPTPLATTPPSKQPQTFDGSNGQYLLNFEIQIQPGLEHLDVLFKETKAVLAYIQRSDPMACYMPKPDRTDIAPLSSPSDPSWPTCYLASDGWYQTSTGYLFQLAPITDVQLTARLDGRRSSSRQTSAKKQRTADLPMEKGPVAMYATMNLYTRLPRINHLIDSVNIDLRRSNVKISLKTLQCWESHSKKMLCGVNNGLCLTGVQQLLLHKMKELEKKLCRHGKINMLDWYDEPLPDINVTLRPIRPLQLPRDEDERASLTFDTFPWESKLTYFLEASDAAWYRLEPLLNLMVETNWICQTFGPSAHIMDVPEGKPTIGKVRSHHRFGRISMGYNLATTILECNEVQLYDYEVKVAMEEIEEVAPDGSTHLIRPKPPYAKTTLRKELQRIRLNGEQVFHTAVMTGAGPDIGLSRVVITYDPRDPLRQEKYEFARKTISNLACFMHHWLIQCGYNASTRVRLMRSFYIEKAQLAEYSSWDPTTCIATSHFATKTSTYLDDNARYDPAMDRQKQTPKLSPTVIDMSDQVRTNLLHSLGHKLGDTCVDVNSTITGVSPHTGDGDISCDSTVNSTNTTNKILKTKDFAIQLADSRAQLADSRMQLLDTKTKMSEQEKMIEQLQRQLEQLQQTNVIAETQAQQGAPHLSGSGVSPPRDPGGGETLQGS